MKKLEYKAHIAANRQKVWDTMLQPETYKEWTSAGTGGSTYEGNWAAGENIRFLAPGMGGTMATITDFRPHEYVNMRHIAVIDKDGSENRDSKATKDWVGSTEAYRFTEKNGHTELTVTIESGPDWVQMFNEWWPPALAKLKEVCER